MLMEESSEQFGQEQTSKSEGTIINIGNDPVMLLAVDVLSVLGSKNQVILRAKGNSIPNAVAIANIITEKNAERKFESSKNYLRYRVSCRYWQNDINC